MQLYKSSVRKNIKKKPIEIKYVITVMFSSVKLGNLKC